MCEWPDPTFFEAAAKDPENDVDESDEANISTRFLIVKKDHKKAQGYEPHDLRANDSGEGNRQGYSLIMKKWDQDQNAGTAGKCLELNIENIKVMPHRYSYYIHAKVPFRFYCQKWIGCK